MIETIYLEGLYVPKNNRIIIIGIDRIILVEIKMPNRLRRALFDERAIVS